LRRQALESMRCLDTTHPCFETEFALKENSVQSYAVDALKKRTAA